MGACYGDAMLAGIAAGVVDEDANWSPVIDHVKPNLANKAIYDQLYGVYRHLHHQTVDLQHTTAHLQRTMAPAGAAADEADAEA